MRSRQVRRIQLLTLYVNAHGVGVCLLLVEGLTVLIVVIVETAAETMPAHAAARTGPDTASLEIGVTSSTAMKANSDEA